jgi:hypothetical protein
MAKAKPKPIGDEIWFNDAVTLLAERCGAATVAEDLLIEGLKDDDVPWSHMLPNGTRVIGDDAFFKNLFIDVNRMENRASIGAPIAPITPRPSGMLTKVIAIKVSRKAALALVSAVPVAPAKPSIIAEAKRMKRDGEIPEGIKKTSFAKALADKFGVTPKYVSNNLEDWGLWPVSDIK